MVLIRGDVVFARGGTPAVVIGRDPNNGGVYLDDNKKQVQAAVEFGVKNGLTPEERESFVGVLREVSSTDKKQEIEALYAQIQEMRANNADTRLLRYLDGELNYRMSREKYFPKTISVDLFSIGV